MRLSALGKLLLGSALAALLALRRPAGRLGADRAAQGRLRLRRPGRRSSAGATSTTGRKAVKKAFGDKVDTNYVESVPEGPDAERVIRELAGNRQQA